MAINFSEKYGLPTDRTKLMAGLEDFNIVKIQIVESKKKYDTREDGIDGTQKIVKKNIAIAYLDVLVGHEKEVQKFYSPNAAIVSACKNMMKDFGKPDGTMKDAIHIDEVKEAISENGKPYIFFA